MNEQDIRVFTDGPLYPLGFGSRVRSWLEENNWSLRFHVDLVNIEKVDLPLVVPHELRGFHYVLYDTFACRPVYLIETQSCFEEALHSFLHSDWSAPGR